MMAGRQRRGLLLLAAVALAVLLLGRGLGVVPSSSPSTPAEPTPQQVTPPPLNPPPSPPPPTPDQGSGQQQGERGGGAPAPGPESMAAAAGIAADHLQSRMSVVRAAAQRGLFGEGFAVLAELQQETLAPAQSAELDAGARALRAALQAAAAALVTSVRQGHVPAAHQQLAALLAEQPTFVAPELRACLPADWPDVQRVDVPRGYVLRAEPLAAGRAVQANWAGSDITARVADARPDEVTLRFVQGNGVTFPSLPVITVAPVEPTAQEAGELALAAIAADRGQLARLWLACALDKGAPVAGSRLAEVAALLR